MLMPLLPDFDCVALDLAGQGTSDYRVGDGAYDIWRDIPEIREVVDQLGWDTFSILGHSRGAMISTLFSGTFPERMEKICLLDAVTPFTTSEPDLPAQLASSIEGLSILKIRKSTFFSSYERASEARTSGRYPLTAEASRLLAERSVMKGDEGYFWRYDPHLLIPSQVRLSEAQAKAFVDRFPRPARVIAATRGVLADESRPAWMDAHRNLDIKMHEGEHHLQLAGDNESMDKLVSEINDYFNND